MRAQLLDSNRPTDLLDVVRHLTMLQYDQTAAVAPNADVVLWTRLGSSYSPADLAEALEERSLIELAGMVRPRDDIALYTAEMAEWPGSGELRDWHESNRDWVEANDACRIDILDRLGSSAPMAARQFPDTCEVPWRSSGWTNNQNVVRMLDFLSARGEVAVVGHRGRERLWELAERVYPDDPIVPLDEALRVRNERRLRALGIARLRSVEVPGEPNDVGAAGEPAVVDGVKGEWRVDPAQLGQSFSGRTAILSPLDRLIFDRKRMEEIFEFDYQLEMYKPVAKRRWGYWVMPILHNDRLVGKVDATSDRKAGVLRVDAIYQDIDFSRRLADEVRDELEDLALLLRLDLRLIRAAS